MSEMKMTAKEFAAFAGLVAEINSIIAKLPVKVVIDIDAGDMECVTMHAPKMPKETIAPTIKILEDLDFERDGIK